VKNSNPVAAAASLLCAGLLAVSLGARFWAANRAGDFTGPTHLAVSGDEVFLFAAGTLFHLSAAGALIDDVAFARTGVSGDPIDLRGDSRGGLLVASQQPARLRLCDTTTWACQELEFGAPEPPQRQFKVLLDKGGFDLLYTDSRGDALWGRTAGEAAPRPLLAPGTLAGPNDLAFDDAGRLWVADTDHRRIVELVQTPDGAWLTGREHSAVNEHTVDGRFYPMMMAPGGDGNWWLTQASEFSNGRADLVIYDPDQGVIERIALPGSTFATDIAAVGDDLLVTDMDAYAVYRVNSETHSVTRFGDALFGQSMGALRDDAAHYSRLSNLAMVAVVVFAVLMLVAAFIATPREKRWTPVPRQITLTSSNEAIPKTGGIHWLRRSERLETWLRMLPVIWFGLLALALAGAGMLYYFMQTQIGGLSGENLLAARANLGTVLLLLFLPLGLSLVLGLQFSRNMQNRLGVDGRKFFIRTRDGREIGVGPEKIAYTDRAILYGPYLFPLMLGKNLPVYAEGEVETWIAPMLGKSMKLNPWQDLKYRWERGNGLFTWSIVAGVLGGMLLLLILNFPQ